MQYLFTVLYSYFFVQNKLQALQQNKFRIPVSYKNETAKFNNYQDNERMITRMLQ